jgi:hypothetical protein
MTYTIEGKCSEFGGPLDGGVGAGEGLALISSLRQLPEVFLPSQPPHTTGLARRLDPSKLYIACRWDYRRTPVSHLLGIVCEVHAVRTGITIGGVHPVDWGPNARTGRIADLSPGLMKNLGIDTGDIITVTVPL